MIERKMAYTDKVEKMIDKDTVFLYLVVYEIPLVEAMVYHLVHDKKKEKIVVADLLGLSISRISHAYSGAEKKFQSLS